MHANPQLAKIIICSINKNGIVAESKYSCGYRCWLNVAFTVYLVGVSSVIITGTVRFTDFSLWLFIEMNAHQNHIKSSRLNITQTIWHQSAWNREMWFQYPTLQNKVSKNSCCFPPFIRLKLIEIKNKKREILSCCSCKSLLMNRSGRYG